MSLDIGSNRKLCSDSLLFCSDLLYILHVVFEVILHGVESVSQLTDLITGFHRDLLIKFTFTDFQNAAGEPLDRSRDGSGYCKGGHNYRDSHDGEEDHKQAEDIEYLILHVPLRSFGEDIILSLGFQGRGCYFAGFDGRTEYPTGFSHL